MAGRPSGPGTPLACQGAAVVVVAGAAQAGPVFFAGKMEGGKFVADKAVRGPCFEIRYSTLTVDVRDGRADVRTVETVLGAVNGETAAVCLVPLPAGMEAKDASITAKRPDEQAGKPVPAEFLSAEDARKVCQALAEGTGSAAVMALAGRPALLIRQYNLPPKVEMTVQYSSAATQAGGLLSVECPMPAARLARLPVSRVTIAGTVRDKLPLRAVFSPSHEVTVQRKGLSEANVRGTIDNWTGADDFRLLYVADEDDLGLRVLAHRAEGEDDGYFLWVGNPTGGKDEKVIDKDAIFVLDASGSMRGEKIEQARSAIDYCLGKLNPGDRFNLVAFASDVRTFRPDLVANTQANLSAAREFADSLVANGLTNIGGALDKALAGAGQTRRPRIVIFLTDGAPTAGQMVPDEILKAVPAQNTSGARIFVLGVGHDVNAHLLDRLAEATDGWSEYVCAEEAIDVKVANLYQRLSSPVLTNVTVAFGDLKTSSVYPAKLPALFKGTEIMIAGRYRGGGKHVFTLVGSLAGKETKYTVSADLPEQARPADEFVATLWASRKIGYLLQEIRLHGENKELIEEVVRLSKKFGIVTEYTAFLALAKGEISDKEARETALRNFAAAREQQAGQWAFNQARNDRAMQEKVAQSAAANSFLDARGQVRQVQTVANVGRRALYYRDGQWQDANQAGDRRKRVVKLFSQEYYDLLKDNNDFAKAQAIGWNVSMNVGDERIEVEKDGSTKEKNLELEKQQEQPPQPDPNQQMQQRLPHQQLDMQPALPLRNATQPANCLLMRKFTNRHNRGLCCANNSAMAEASPCRRRASSGLFSLASEVIALRHIQKNGGTRDHSTDFRRR